jgi:hypothetical protein
MLTAKERDHGSRPRWKSGSTPVQTMDLSDIFA